MDSIIWVIIYFVVAWLCTQLVRFIGPVAIDYVLEENYDIDSAPRNVAYRILAPVVCTNAAVCVVYAVVSLVGTSAPTACYLPAVFYWLVIGLIKITKQKMLSLPAFILEASTSIVIALMTDVFFIRRLLAGDWSVLDDSSIAFEIQLAIIAVIIQASASLFIRKQYKLKCERNDAPYTSPSETENHRESTVNTSERNLCSYEQRFDHLLPRRYSDDPLLKIIIYTIMAIEDTNRPEGFRILERLACHVGLAKTTGIMQQRSEKPLTDEESVILAARTVEDMWDSFLRRYARFSPSDDPGKKAQFTSTWYQYSYTQLADTLEKSFGALYGDYCGTRLLEAGGVLREVRQFYERGMYRLTPNRVIAAGNLFPLQSKWFNEKPFYWKNEHTAALATKSIQSPGQLTLYSCTGELATTDNVNLLCSQLYASGASILEISFDELLIAKVTTDRRIILSDSYSFWTVSGMS